MHASMQFSDSDRAKARDVGLIFDRAVERKVAWITGTEAGAGAGPLRGLLKDGAEEHGYRFAHALRQDSWIAVDKALIDGGWDEHYEEVIGGKAKSHTAKGVMAVGFDNDELGRINVIACHYLTKGRPGAKSAEYRQHVPENTALARAIGDYAKQVGRGTALVFYGGDQNIVDRTDDTFMGEPLTSAWDELKKWENTGHGNIDVIASYDHDGRVKAAYCRALDDSEFALATDHFVVEAGFDVQPLRLKPQPVEHLCPSCGFVHSGIIKS